MLALREDVFAAMHAGNHHARAGAALVNLAPDNPVLDADGALAEDARRGSIGNRPRLNLPRGIRLATDGAGRVHLVNLREDCKARGI